MKVVLNGDDVEFVTPDGETITRAYSEIIEFLGLSKSKGTPKNQGFSPVLAFVKSKLDYEPDLGCRLWHEGKHKGQPFVQYQGKRFYIRGEAWNAAYSLIPKGFRIKMVCGSPECVSVKHMVLEPIGALINVEDARGNPENSRVFEISDKNQVDFEAKLAAKENRAQRSLEELNSLYSFAEGEQKPTRK